MKLLCWFWKFLGFKICVKVFQFLWWWILQRWIQNRKLQFLRLNRLRLQSWVLNLLYNAQNFVKKEEEEGMSRFFFFCIAELGYDAGATFCWFLYVGCKHELIWVLKCIMEYLKNQGFCVCVWKLENSTRYVGDEVLEKSWGNLCVNFSGLL